MPLLAKQRRKDRSMPINTICLSGNLGADAQARTTAKGLCTVKFSVAFTERRKDENGAWEDATSWVNAVIFGERAQKVAPLLTKGSGVCLQGRLHQVSWRDKDGNKKTGHEIYVDEISVTHQKEAQSAVADEDIVF